MELFLVWFFLSIAVGVYASNKGRSGFGFFLLSLLISPLIGFIFALAAKDLSKSIQPTGEPNPDTHNKCPDCKELVLKEARICKHCGCKLIPDSEANAKTA